jgi:hypothetical protein
MEIKFEDSYETPRMDTIEIELEGCILGISGDKSETDTENFEVDEF